MAVRLHPSEDTRILTRDPARVHLLQVGIQSLFRENLEADQKIKAGKKIKTVVEEIQQTLK